MGKENFEGFYKDHKTELEEAEDSAIEADAKEKAQEAMPEVLDGFEELLRESAERGEDLDKIKSKMKNLEAFNKALHDERFMEELKASGEGIKKETIQYKVLKNLENIAEHDDYHIVRVKAQEILDKFKEELDNQ